MAGTRKSHFLSRFYLGGFTLSGRREDRFWVFNKKEQRRWPMRAEEAGHQRDLFRLEGPEARADDLENAFGSVENAIAPILREVIKTKSLPTDPQSFSLLLHLPALNAARPPAEIDALSDIADDIVRALIVADLTPERHEEILQDWTARGRDISGVADLAELKKRISEKGHVRTVLDKNYLLAQVTGRSAMLVDLLHAKQWSLLETTDEKGYFICSDRPVMLMNNQNLPPDARPRFDDERFHVIMPLSKDLCLVGHTYGNEGSGVACRETVRLINHIVEETAAEYVYSPRAEYSVAAASDLLDWRNTASYRADVRAALRR